MVRELSLLTTYMAKGGRLFHRDLRNGRRALDPNLPLGLQVAGFAFAHKGMFEECADAFERAAILADSSPGLAYLGYGYGISGRKQDDQRDSLATPAEGEARVRLPLSAGSASP